MKDDTVYLTSDGLAKLESELNVLVTVRRAEVAELIRDAKEAGDVSENAAYDEAKEQQAFVEGRILHLEDLLKRSAVIESPNGKDEVAIGSKVTVAEPGSPKEDFQIVGSAEANPSLGYISNESPLGQALLGKRVGEEAAYTTPGGDELVFKVIKIG